MENGKKFDENKPRMDLLDSDALVQIAQVMTFGAKKYGDHNWRGGIKYSRLIAAALRHIFAWLGGKDKDDETGLPHLAHAACCLMMLLWTTKYRKDLDDRFKAIKSDAFDSIKPIENDALTCIKCGKECGDGIVYCCDTRKPHETATCGTCEALEVKY